MIMDDKALPSKQYKGMIHVIRESSPCFLTIGKRCDILQMQIQRRQDVACYFCVATERRNGDFYEDRDNDR